MVYVVKKHENGFTLTDLHDEKREFANEAEVTEFLSGWALKGMKPGDEKYITDSEVVHQAKWYIRVSGNS